MRWLGGAFSLGALVVVVTLLAGGGGGEFLRTLAGARVEGLAGAVSAALAVEVVKCSRWQLLLGMRILPIPRLIALLFTARLLNALVPLRGGDLWRVAAVARVEGRSLVAAGGSVVAEKLLDGVGLGPLAAALAMLVGGEAAGPAGGAALGAATLAGLLALPYLCKGQVERWAAGIQHLRRAGIWIAGGLLTLMGLGLGLLVNLVVLWSLGLPVDPALALAMLVAGYAAGLVPSGPGQLGVFELAVAAPLVALGLPQPSALLAALGVHLVLLMALALGGLLAFPMGLLGRPAGRDVAGVSPAEELGR